MLVMGSCAFFAVKFSSSDSTTALTLEDEQSKTENLTVYPQILILFILESNDSSLPVTFFYTDIDIKNNSFSLKVIENSLDLSYKNKNYKLENLYKIKGINAVRNALQDYLKIDFARFVKFDSDSFDNIIKIFGSNNIILPSNIADYFNFSDSFVSSAKDIEKIITFNNYTGEQNRYDTAEFILTEIISSADRDRILTSLDFYFNSFINSVKTDITAIDFIDYKEEISDLLRIE
jgi:anionic cell wall polymer biosynthesis LytR-Cps2A-Psr (LCP) family protein